MLLLCNVNIWVLLVSTVVSLMIITVWYSDYILGKEWRKYMGNLFTTKPSIKDMLKMFIGQFILILITNFVLARILFYTETTTWTQGFAVALFIWVGFVASVESGAIIWEKKPWKLVAINAGAYLVALIASGMIIAVWR